jgi:hypothetical protein
MPVLRALLVNSAASLKAQNKFGHLPLHLCLAQGDLIYEAAHMLLEAFPGGAAVKDATEVTPLFLACMRDHTTSTSELSDLCRAICRACPTASAAMNRTRSHPLHFLARRQFPNRDVLQLLLQRFPAAAAQKNDFQVRD